MKGILLSPAARADLEEIWDYTARTWGRAQAERYVLEIREACNPWRGERGGADPIDDIRPGYLKLAVRSHVLFYRLTESGQIDIVRILHRKMDVPGRLAET